MEEESEYLENDHSFLIEGGAFTSDPTEHYIDPQVENNDDSAQNR